MQRVRVTLRLAADGQEEILEASGELAADERGRTVQFGSGEARYAVSVAETVRIERRGGLSYALELDPLAETEAILSTPYGSLPVRVRTAAVEREELESGLRVAAEYDLILGAYVQRRSVEFMFEGADCLFS